MLTSPVPNTVVPQLANFLTPDMVWLFFAVCVAVLAIGSIALIYHWWEYRFKRPKVVQAAGMYIVGLLAIVGIAATFARQLVSVL